MTAGPPPDDQDAAGLEPAAEPTALVVVNYGSHALLAQNLPVTSPPDVHTIVVDSFSTDQERAAVSELAATRGWHLLTPETNVGFGIGCNLGAARAIELGAQVLVFLNPDAALDAASRNRLVRVVADPRVVVAPRIERPDGSVWSSGTVDLYLATGTTRLTGKRAPDAAWKRATRRHLAVGGVLRDLDAAVDGGGRVRPRVLPLLGGRRPVVARARLRRFAAGPRGCRGGSR